MPDHLSTRNLFERARLARQTYALTTKCDDSERAYAPVGELRLSSSLLHSDARTFTLSGRDPTWNTPRE